MAPKKERIGKMNVRTFSVVSALMLALVASQICATDIGSDSAVERFYGPLNDYLVDSSNAFLKLSMMWHRILRGQPPILLGIPVRS